MNKLVIVGNGFDLAHGLPTGYCDFIDWYWKATINNISGLKNYQDDLIEVQLKFRLHVERKASKDYESIQNYTDLKQLYRLIPKFIIRSIQRVTLIDVI